jgi:MYND finger
VQPPPDLNRGQCCCGCLAAAPTQPHRPSLVVVSHAALSAARVNQQPIRGPAPGGSRCRRSRLQQHAHPIAIRRGSMAAAWATAPPSDNTIGGKDQELTGEHRCAGCGRQQDGLLRCTASKCVHYCGKECQRDNRMRHKKECQRFQETKQAEPAERAGCRVDLPALQCCKLPIYNGVIVRYPAQEGPHADDKQPRGMCHALAGLLECIQ